MSKPSQALAAVLLLVCGSAYAMRPGVELTPMEERAKACGACHGGDGISINPVWPNLAGQKETYLAKQLRDFRSGVRKDPLMVPMAKPLSDKDIVDFAKHFSSLQPAPQAAPPAAPPVTK